MGAVERVKVRMKIGVHELEAEGPRELVMAQLNIWTRLAGLPAATAADGVAGDGDPALRSLFAVDAERQLVTLRASLNGQRRNADAALLLLYGYKNCLGGKGGTEVPDNHLSAALVPSGHGLKVAAGWARKAGRHKHETYALTTPGVQRAAALARRLTLGR
jgi:hypothetical protein